MTCSKAGKSSLLPAPGPRPLEFRAPEHLVTSEQFLELDRLPSRMAFVGGGYISFEFAHIAARAGAAVSIVHRGERPLPLFDPDLVEMLVARTRALGIDIHVRTEVTRIDRRGERFQVEAVSDGETRAFTVDMVVHGAGRVPEIDDLGLDAAGVEWDIRFEMLKVPRSLAAVLLELDPRRSVAICSCRSEPSAEPGNVLFRVGLPIRNAMK